MRRHFHSNLPVLFPCVFDGSLSRSFFRSRISIEWDEARGNHEAYQSVIHCFSIFPRYIRKPLYIVTRIFTLIPTFPSHLASSHKKTPGLTLIVRSQYRASFRVAKNFFHYIFYIFPLSRISSTIFKRERERERDTRIRKRRLSDLSVNSPLPVTRKCNSVFRYSACKSKMVCVSSRNPRRRADRYHEREKDTFLCVLFVYARNNRGKRIEEETDMFLERSCVLELTLRLAHGHLWARQRRENYAISRKLIFLNVIQNFWRIFFLNLILSIYGILLLNFLQFGEILAKFSRKLYPVAKVRNKLLRSTRIFAVDGKPSAVTRLEWRTANGTRLKESNTS